MAEFSDKSTLKKFNVVKFAKNILAEVEAIRSFKKLTDEDKGDSFKKPDESRVNAFFRLIGLPMFVAVENESKKKQEGGDRATGLRHMSPGYSADEQRVALRDKYRIKNAKEVADEEISSLLADRESTLQKIENSIGTNEGNKNMALSLTIPLRLAPNIPDKDNQIEGSIGGGENERTVYKKLFPLITSYREIWPKRNEIAIPFTNKEDRKINNTTALQCPFIETVVRIRLVTAENAGTTTEKDKESEQLESWSGRLAESDYQEVIREFVKLKGTDILEKYILNKLFICLEQLANKWVEVKKKQHLAAKQDIFNISIKTSSSKVNPLGKRVSVSTDLTLRKDTDIGRVFAWLRKREAEEEAFLSLLPSDDIVDANTTGPKTSNVSPGALTNEFAHLLGDTLEQIRKEIRREEEIIKKKTQSTEQLRLEVDMMTGEFSGLSVPDVVAVITGLFLIEKRDLVALLDQETIDIMKKDDTLKEAINSLNVSINPSTAYAAVQNLELAVRGVYTILNLYVRAIENKDKRTARRGKRKKQKPEKNESSLSGRTKTS